MKTGGHYWCDNPKCDDLAYGTICQRCHQPARFVPDSPAQLQAEVRLPTEREHRPKPAVPVTQERGQQLFAEIRQKLSLL